jgi:hypothetical protein
MYLSGKTKKKIEQEVIIASWLSLEIGCCDKERK